MCEASATAADIRMAMPRPVTGSAVDPIMLEPVDEVVVTTLVDNVYDARSSTVMKQSRGHHSPPERQRHRSSNRESLPSG